MDMWHRSELKANAKAALKHYYWMGFAVCLLYGVMINVAQIGNYLYQFYTGFMEGLRSSGALIPTFLVALEGPVAILALFLMCLGLVFVFLVGLPLQVGLCRFFMESRQFKSSFTTLFWAFRKGRYGKCLKTTFVSTMIILAWTLIPVLPGSIIMAVLEVPFFILFPVTLLLCIPGMVKSYELYLVNYLVAENPDLDSARARRLSRQIINGDKWNLFVLGLSFIGWILLGILTCGIGLFFLEPYLYATYAEFYALMRAKAFARGFATEQELIGFHPDRTKF